MEHDGDMVYWTDGGWTVFACAANDNLQFKQGLPFALIGSGAHCHLRLPVQDDLDTAYFACNFDDRIEIWPLCAVAFPAWGMIPPEVEVLLGQYRLRFDKSGSPRHDPPGGSLHSGHDSANSPGAMSSDVELTMAWDQKSVTKKIARSVTIIGSGHPSVWRTRGRGMLACDHAIVCANHRVWLVDLHPPSKSLVSPAVSELTANREYYQVGDMRLSLGPATVECKASIARRKRLQAQLDLATACTPSGADRTKPVEMTPALVSTTTDCSLTPKSGASAIRKPAATVPTETVSTEPIPIESVPVETVPAASVLDGLDCPEMLTSRLTGRLVSINQSRFMWGKLMRTTVSAVTFAAAIVFLFWLFR